MRSDLTAAELRTLSVELRRGELTDELAYMLSWVSDKFADPQGASPNRSNLNLAAQAIKRRRISKENVFNILQSLSSIKEISENDSVNTMLAAFFETADDKLSKNLLDILNASGPQDPYLKGISDTRR
jgi:hypothetical protein